MDEPYTNLLDEALEAWEGVRRGTLAEAGVIPDDRWDFRPHPEARNVTGIVRHILESGLMMVGELGRPDGDFRRQSFHDFIEEYAGDIPEDADPPELRDRLTMAFAEGAATLRAAGELHMLQLIHRFDGERGTRLAWFHHGIAHEMYHRGQLASYARRMDLVPAITQGMQGS